jgi:DNA-binding CsgD family transcriptional regulator|tara:strand:- start:857 stop:1165 length:309 start_codon:yes stop_codon:yes gene_type:complete
MENFSFALRANEIAGLLKVNTLEMQKKLVKKAFFRQQEIMRKVKFTDSEREICAGLYIGLSAKLIGELRDCSPRTVENHIANIKRKVGGGSLTPLLISSIFL